MVRISLTFCLVLTTLAGPRLCCCWSGPIAALFAPQSDEARPAEGVPHAASCCHHRPASGRDHNNTPVSEHKKPGHPHCPSCPCKQTGLDTALPSHDGEHKQFQTRSSAERPIDAWTGDATSLSVAVRTDSPGLERGLALPFLSAHDLLTTFHILRC